MPRALALASTVLVLAGGCGGQNAPPAPSEVTGVILTVETDDGGEITGFTLRSGEDTYEIAIADDVAYGFDLNHLNEHLAQALPVRCRLEERDGTLYALTIEDA